MTEVIQTLAEPRLYILARSDLYQLNPGKLAAQAAHAGTMFVRDVHVKSNDELTEQYALWDGGRGFGTKITLTATQAEILETVEVMKGFKLLTGVVVDPTYPFSNYYGDFFTAEELTCAYVFVPTDVPQEALDYLRQFKLHP